ncbi:hypothetical protein ANN_12984 [Periplaneta americana]|uniref:Uncharacterized protein n=1 Tax=Periplaneta americana TaxID=6978 RepID=A0ABQ8TI49_PERAM|nr:hypothetical protein ANN_12984 [Periplaneta americana]
MVPETRDLGETVGRNMGYNYYQQPLEKKCAPLNKIKTEFLNDLDKVTRGACKELIGLPHDCPDGMLYSPKKDRGLSDLVSEKVSALSKLNITTIDAINWSGRKIRKQLRNEAFETWTNHTFRGKGVIVYSDLSKAWNDVETDKEKELAGSLVEKKLIERCTGRNGEREKSSEQKKIYQIIDIKIYRSYEETKRKV